MAQATTHSSFPKRSLLICGAILLALCQLAGSTNAQDRYSEEIIVQFLVPKLISQDIFTMYDGATVYLPLIETFKLLGMHADGSAVSQRFYGTIMGESDKFEIDLRASRITVRDQTFPLERSQYFLSELDIYIRIDQWGRLFELPISFDFSELRVYLPRDDRYPAIQKMRRRLAQEQLRRERTDVQDTHLMPRKSSTVDGAAVDWRLSMNSIQSQQRYYYGLTLGGMLLGGGLNLSSTGSNDEPFDPDRMNFKWQYALDNNSYLTSVTLGDVYTAGTFSRSLRGAQITNRPVVSRRFYQTIEVTDFVGPGWEVELYVNGRLTDFTYTDNSGTYHFLVDITYGSSYIELKMYGPSGEVKTQELYHQVPFNLVPPGTAEYTVTAGNTRSQENQDSYLQGSLHYGIVKSLTAGLSLETPLSGNRDSLPNSYALDASYQVRGDLAVSGSYIDGYELRGNVNFNRPSFLTFSGSYSVFQEDPVRNPVRLKSRAVASVSKPLRYKDQYLGVRGFVTSTQYHGHNDLTASLGLSGSFWRTQFNYLGTLHRTGYSNRTGTSLISRFFAMPRFVPWVFPQFSVEYDHTNSMLRSYGVHLSKRVFRTGRLALSYERDAISKSNTISLSLDLYNSFATMSSRARRSAGRSSFTQTQSGSFVVDKKSGTILMDRRTSVGFGSAVIRPFRDDNNNGVYDEGESFLSGLKARIRGARGKVAGKNGFYYYDRLRPYDQYTVEIDTSSMDNPLLKPSHDRFTVEISPNMVTTIDVPVVVGAEINGTVTRDLVNGTFGVSGIKVAFVEQNTEVLTEISTFASGEFYYLGLRPGQYRAYIDSEQLARLGYRAQPPFVEFEVKSTEHGDIIEGISFQLIRETGE